MARWKMIAAAVAALALALAAPFGYAAWQKRAVQAEGDRFFRSVASSQPEEVYKTMSGALRKTTSEQTFSDFLRGRQLATVVEHRWSKVAVNGGSADIEGTMRVPAGKVIPVTMALARENGTWKILSVHIEQSEPEPPKIPTSDEVFQLAFGTLTSFVKSLEANDFQAFYDALATPWKEQTTPDALRESFKTLHEAKLPWEMTSPNVALTATRMDAENVLHLESSVAVRGGKVRFEMEYFFEAGQWRLAGVHIRSN